MNISQAEELTGITKQNIRFYEKQGLLSPERNTENSYREYSPEDIRTLKVIKLLRKLQMPVEQIRQVLSQDISLSDAIRCHQEKLQSDKEQLEAAIAMCAELAAESLSAIDIDARLKDVEEREKAGGIFANILNDFIAVAKASEKASFGFSPDTIVSSPREFTEALFHYADENNLNLVITKESMYPEFLIDGVEYTACRIFSRYGAYIRCEMVNPQAADPEHVATPAKKVYRFLWKALFPFLLFLYLLLRMLPAQSASGVRIAVALFFTAIIVFLFGFFFPRVR